MFNDCLNGLIAPFYGLFYPLFRVKLATFRVKLAHFRVKLAHFRVKRANLTLCGKGPGHPSLTLFFRMGHENATPGSTS